MILIPAIDIKDGKVVRLFQGDFGKQTGYDPYPLMAAKRWKEKGAQWLHVVDLDGAKDGVGPLELLNESDKDDDDSRDQERL